MSAERIDKVHNTIRVFIDKGGMKIPQFYVNADRERCFSGPGTDAEIFKIIVENGPLTERNIQFLSGYAEPVSGRIKNLLGAKRIFFQKRRKGVKFYSSQPFD